MPRNWIHDRLVGPYVEMRAEPFRRGLRLVERHGTAAFTDVDAVAETEGYRVIYDEELFYKFRKKKVGACIVRGEEGTKRIFIDPSQNRTYQRSSILHEIAHDKLGHDPTKQDRRQEHEANLFTFAVDFRTMSPEEAAQYEKQNRDIEMSVARFALWLVFLAIVAHPIAFLSTSFHRRTPNA